MLEPDLTAIWTESILRIPPTGWRLLADIDLLPPAVRADSAMWAERFLTDAANPHLRPHAAQWSFVLATEDTPDAIRAGYRADRYDLDTVETRAYLLVRLRLREFSAAAIQEAADRLIQPAQSGSRWRFQFVETPSEGSRFSTSPASNPLTIASWDDLVEGGVRNGAPYFLRFKKHHQRQGYPNLGAWFDPDFRARAK
ncbi:MAG: hypothetical protein JNK48_27265 [Bryobacterales bacterium]|nr:hypothetical protein [Bryobacterales bacterium]